MHRLVGVATCFLAAGVASAVQCDWHLRSVDVTFQYNNEASNNALTLFPQIMKDTVGGIVEAFSDLLGTGHIVTVSGNRFSSADSFLKDREGNSLGLCTQRDTWGGVFTEDDYDASEMLTRAAEETWFHEVENVEGEDLSLLGIVERMRDSNKYHPNRLNLQFVFTERLPKLSGTACDEEVSIETLLQEKAKGGHFISIIALTEPVAEAWKALCYPSMLCQVFLRPSAVDLKRAVDLMNVDRRKLWNVEDFYGIGPCNCFAEDVVNVKMSWVWPMTLSASDSHQEVVGLLSRLFEMTKMGSEATLKGGSINNFATFRGRPYGGVNAPCVEIERIAADKLPRGAGQAWDDLEQALREVSLPVLVETASSNAALNAIGEELVARQSVGEIQVISVLVENEPLFEGGDCEDEPNIPRLRNYLMNRPEIPAYIVVYVVKNSEPLVNAWKEFCENELPGRCEVIDTSTYPLALSEMEYVAKITEIRSKFACESEIDPTLPPLPTTTSPVTPPTPSTSSTTPHRRLRV